MGLKERQRLREEREIEMKQVQLLEPSYHVHGIIINQTTH
jgi:hypothetical protein